jgi:hypothetical protein
MSNDLKKTIKINPEIFNMGGKTKKNKERKQYPINVPLISPNILKNKLLKRIKEHKTKETTTQPNDTHPKPSEIKYNNEFNDSLEYLQILSNNKKKEERQQYKDDLYKKTLRNNFSINTEKLNNQYVETELPEELKQDYYNTVDNSTSTLPIKLNYNIDTDIPYGCLKGGFKKTYRNYSNQTPQLNKSPVVTQHLSERETKLNKLKERILSKPSNYASLSKPVTNLIKPPVYSHTANLNPQPLKEPIHNLAPEPPIVRHNIAPKKHKSFIKNTTLRKYVLGKSNHKRTVSILIKDKNTQKKVLNAQREIKKKDLPSIKKYLHSHNLIMAGSNAPIDVIRKIYESAMLAGEITNNNRDSIIHNLMKP